jgi:hypothetical protein
MHYCHCITRIVHCMHYCHCITRPLHALLPLHHSSTACTTATASLVHCMHYCHCITRPLHALMPLHHSSTASLAHAMSPASSNELKTSTQNHQGHVCCRGRSTALHYCVTALLHYSTSLQQDDGATIDCTRSTCTHARLGCISGPGPDGPGPD